MYECTVMLTFVDKSLLVKFYYLSQESTAEDLRRFQTEENEKRVITSTGLIPLTWCFEKTRCLQNRPRSGAPRLSEVRTSSVISEMNTLREESTSGVPASEYSGRELARSTSVPKTSVFPILHGVFQLYPYKLQSLQLLFHRWNS